MFRIGHRGSQHSARFGGSFSFLERMDAMDEPGTRTVASEWNPSVASFANCPSQRIGRNQGLAPGKRQNKPRGRNRIGDSGTLKIMPTVPRTLLNSLYGSMEGRPAPLHQKPAKKADNSPIGMGAQTQGESHLQRPGHPRNGRKGRSKWPGPVDQWWDYHPTIYLPSKSAATSCYIHSGG